MSKHGGAWKVAYADFITAMMALFMVLWILGTEEELLEQMQEYFRNPPSPWDRMSGKYMLDIGDFEGIRDEGRDEEAFFEAVDPAIMKGILNTFYQLLQIDTTQTEIPPVEIALTSDGLRVMIYDRQDTPMFTPGSTDLTEWGEFLLQNLAWLLSRYEFETVIEGHSAEIVDSRGREGYGPWELSVDRANQVRRSLEFYAGGEVGINRVTGYGALQPLEEGEGNGRTNQRITLSLSLANPIQDLPLITDPN